MVKYLQQHGFLPIARSCPVCQHKMSLISQKSFSDGCLWKCYAKFRPKHRKTKKCGKTVFESLLGSMAHIFQCWRLLNWRITGG